MSATPAKRRHRATNPDRFEVILDAIEQDDMSPFEFFNWYLTTSDHPYIVQNRPRLFSRNWEASGRPLIMGMLNLCDEATRDTLILEEVRLRCPSEGTREADQSGCGAQAAAIVYRQAESASSEWISSKDINPSDLTTAASKARFERNRIAYSFLDSLIHGVLLRRPSIENHEENVASEIRDEVDEVDEEEDEVMDLNFDFSGTEKESFKGRSREAINLERSKVQVRFATDAIICQIKFKFNRRDCGWALENGIIALTTGITKRAQMYLYDAGWCTSRDATDSACTSLTLANQSVIKQRLKDGELVTGVLDNYDRVTAVNQTQADLHSEGLHGTFGYVHFVPKEFNDALNLGKYREHQKSLSLVSVADLQPSPESGKSFFAGGKAAAYRSLAKYAPHLGIGPQDPRCTPPVVEQCAVETPDVMNLQLMDEADNSSENFGLVRQAYARQLAMTEEEFAEFVMLIEVDGGSAALAEGLRKLRFPAQYAFDGMESDEILIGGSHLEWVIEGAKLRRFAGEKGDGAAYPGTLFKLGKILGRPAFNTDKIKDFNKLERLLRDVTAGLLLDILLVILKKETLESVTKSDIADGKLEAALETLCTDYLSADAIERAKKNAAVAPAFYESILRLVALVDCEEGVAAKQDGDIGRVIHFWERSLPFLLGAKGVRQYRTHLPHLLLQLKVDFPPLLRNLARSRMLITPSGRNKRFCFKDFYLETFNYWLDYFGGLKNTKFDWDRLRDKISSNILLFRDLMYKMKRNTGRDIIYRNHTIGMNKASFSRLMHELRTSKVHLPIDTSQTWNRAVVDASEVGAEKLMAMKPADLQRFRYGPGRVGGDDGEGDDDDPDIVFLFGEAGLDLAEAADEGAQDE